MVGERCLLCRQQLIEYRQSGEAGHQLPQRVLAVLDADLADLRALHVLWSREMVTLDRLDESGGCVSPFSNVLMRQSQQLPLPRSLRKCATLVKARCSVQ